MAEVDREKVCVLVPTRNEAETIGDVIDRFHAIGFENILVIDGESSDGTPDVAVDRGARVVQQSGTGKGQAVREGLEHVEAPYVLMLDGDGTYRPEDADSMLGPLFDGTHEHVIGNRFADMREGAMSRLNRFGNRVINTAFRTVHGRDFRDILSGYRAFTLESVHRFDLNADGFGIETELSVECAKHDVPTAVVPITYEPRPAGSEPNLRPFRDGALILLTLYSLARTNNPLFFFGSMGLASTGFGVVVGAYVVVEWFTRTVSHETLTVTAAFAILFGVQLLMFAVLSDIIVSLHREQMRLIRRLDSNVGGRRMEGRPRSADGNPEVATGSSPGDGEEIETEDGPLEENT